MKKNNQGMSLIVKTITRCVVGFILLYGLYIMLHGHLSPGGGFAGGVIIALAFILLTLSFGRELASKKLSEKVAGVFESLGALLFIIVALFGLVGGYFFLNFISKGKSFNLFSAGIIPVCNFAIMLKVGAGLFSVFIVLVVFGLFEGKE
jgi:multicomponent Na+:H+ antiporter subunit B